jgi:DNA polymerase III subunit epsilon
MREIVLDTETTGLDPKDGHRVIEIGCVELFNHIPTGETFHVYINPERDVPAEASSISGLTTEFVSKHKVFHHIADDFLAFIADSPLVIHNARFDIKFLNAELDRLGKEIIPLARAVDTVLLARKKFPGSPANLDALCKRFGVDLSKRTKHGALLDSQLLARVYLELLGGRQRSLKSEILPPTTPVENHIRLEANFPYRTFDITSDEQTAHKSFIKTIKDSLWASNSQNP